MHLNRHHAVLSSSLYPSITSFTCTMTAHHVEGTCQILGQQYIQFFCMHMIFGVDVPASNLYLDEGGNERGVVFLRISSLFSTVPTPPQTDPSR
jgi:hypothetical protein